MKQVEYYVLTLFKEQLVEKTRRNLQAAREAYSTAISQRSSSQREVNELLQRKHAWTSNDLERFTALYRSDHANEQAETAAQENLVAAERGAEEAAAKLSASILARYHEEQIWSDKIRRMSTWGTWGLMGVNILLFLVFQIGVEPWRRRRLVKGFEEKVMEALEKEGATSGPAVAHLKGPDHPFQVPTVDKEIAAQTEPKPVPGLPANEEKPSEVMSSAVKSRDQRPSEAKSPMSNLQRMQEFFWDLFSDREIVVSHVELTAIALKGAAAGTFIASALLMFFKSR